MKNGDDRRVVEARDSRPTPAVGEPAGASGAWGGTRRRPGGLCAPGVAQVLLRDVHE